MALVTAQLFARESKNGNRIDKSWEGLPTEWRNNDEPKKEVEKNGVKARHQIMGSSNNDCVVVLGALRNLTFQSTGFVSF